MTKKDFIGKWRIIEMSTWNKDYFDEEVPAYVKIEKDLTGDFHFGYVECQIDGKVIKRPDCEYFEFTFDRYDSGGGNDESGSGWIKLKGKNNAEGEIKFHLGDDSTCQKPPDKVWWHDLSWPSNMVVFEHARNSTNPYVVYAVNHHSESGGIPTFQLRRIRQ